MTSDSSSLALVVLNRVIELPFTAFQKRPFLADGRNLTKCTLTLFVHNVKPRLGKIAIGE
jgi:hypothetical protein